MVSRLRYFVMLILPVMILGLASSIQAADPQTLIKQLPRTYAGEFQWRDSIRKYQVSIEFTDVKLNDTGRVEATGTGVYDAYGEISKVDIRAVIDPDDLFLEIWEYDPAAQGKELEGLYRGSLSADLKSIDATWRGFDKSRGFLKLALKP